MPKYEYNELPAQARMLAGSSGQFTIEKLKVFYPKAGWTELRQALQSDQAKQAGLTYDEKTHVIKVVK